MIKNSQAETLHQAGYLQKYHHAFYYEWPSRPTIDEICKKNDLKLPLSEWWDVYRDREKWIMDDLDKKHIIPIITQEEYAEKLIEMVNNLNKDNYKLCMKAIT